MNEDRIRQIYDLALKKPLTQREEFVHRLCGDAALADKVLALLAARDEMGDFLAEPTGAASEPEPAAESCRVETGEVPGTVIGPYKLLQEIGEGGMGTVWMAEQHEPIKRRVALKVIKLGMDSKQVVARFEAERQALALMDHPNIAKVLDGGMTAEGRPFFVMELVKGVPITEFCDEARLNLRERLELYGEVCQAVQHAHHKGIIHRDIKPANVMVTLHDGRPVPKVIDFGIAKATNQELTQKTLFTEYAQILGTPEYMAPEQASMSGLDIDTRADVYSLGVLLYELLTGTKPFDLKTLLTRGYEELLRTIREEEPPKPSTRAFSTDKRTGRRVSIARQLRPGHLGKELRGDLDWIVVKAMEKDRTRRYETPNGLAADVLRFLADEPVSATPPSAAYRVTKFVRRNKGLVAASIVVLIALLAGVTGTGWAMLRAMGEQERAEVAEETTARELERASEVKRLLKDMLRKVNPYTAQGEDVTLLKRILDSASKRLMAGEVEDPSITAELHEVVGTTYFALSLWDAAETHINEAIDALARTPEPDAAKRLSLQRRLGSLWQFQYRPDEAEVQLRAVVEGCRRIHGDHHIDIAESLQSLALIAGEDGRRDESVRLSRQALEMLDHLESVEPSTRVSYLHQYAQTLMWTERFVDAESRLREAVELARKHLGPSHPTGIQAQARLAEVLHSLGQFEQSRAMHRGTFERMREVFGKNHAQTLTGAANYARFRQSMGEYQEANDLLLDARSRARIHLGENHLVTLVAEARLLLGLTELGRFEEAQELRVGLLDRVVKLLGPTHTRTLELRHFLGRLDEALDDPEAARKHFEFVAKEERRLFGPTLQSMRSELAVARTLLNGGRPAEALPVCVAVRKLLAGGGRAARQDRVTAASIHAMTLAKLGEFDEAMAVASAAVAEARSAGCPPLIVAYALGDRMGVAVEARRWDEALRTAREYLATLEQTEITVARSGRMLRAAQVFRLAGKREEALRIVHQAIERFAKLAPPEALLIFRLKMERARLLYEVKRGAEARAALDAIVAEQTSARGADHKLTLVARSARASMSHNWEAPDRLARELEAILEAQRRVSGPDSVNALSTANRLADLQIHRGRNNAAIRLLKEVVTNGKPKGELQFIWIEAAQRLAAFRRAQSRVAEAEALEKRIDEAHPGTDRDKTKARAAVRFSTARILLARRQYDETRQNMLAGLDLYREIGEEDAIMAVSMRYLADAWEKLGDMGKAAETLRRSHQIERRVHPKGHPQPWGTLTNLGRLLMRARKYDAARVALEESLAVKRGILPKNHLFIRIARGSLIRAYLALQRRDDALPLLREELEYSLAPAAAPNASAPILQQAAWSLLAGPVPELRDPARARRLIERAVALPDVEDDKRYWEYIGSLALAQFLTGDVDQAMATRKRALDVAPGDDEQAELRKRLAPLEARVKDQR